MVERNELEVLKQRVELLERENLTLRSQIDVLQSTLVQAMKTPDSKRRVDTIDEAVADVMVTNTTAEQAHAQIRSLLRMTETPHGLSPWEIHFVRSLSRIAKSAGVSNQPFTGRQLFMLDKIEKKLRRNGAA